MKVSILLFLLIPIFIYSQDEQATAPAKKHKIIFKSQLGLLANYKIPEEDENRKIANVNNALDYASGNRAISSTNSKNATGFAPQFGLEYRFLNRLRLMVDRRTFSSSNKQFYKKSKEESYYFTNTFYLQDKGSYDWNETVLKYGLGYYHPITSFLSIGGLARKYEISQEYSIFRTTNNDQRTFNRYTQQDKEVGSSKISGIVPGIGIEISFLNAFEIRYTYELVNLTGSRYSTLFSNVNGTVLGYNSEDSKFRYKGQIQNLDFGMKIPQIDWLLMRVGITEEVLKRDFKSQYDNYVVFIGRNLYSVSSAQGQAVSSQIYSTYTDSQIRFRNIYIQIEMSHAF